MAKGYSRREFLGYGGIAGGAFAVGAGPRPWTLELGPATSDEPEIEGGVVVADPAEFPSELHERPEFAEMVEAGTLPPVAERIGQDPLVIRPVHEIGTYGGELRRAYIGPPDYQNANNFCAGPDSFFYWDYLRQEIVPNIAREYELNDDGRETVVHLRRGMHWSDGAPFTADDILFWHDEINTNGEITSGADGLRIAGQAVGIEKVDDFTVLYTAPAPHPLLPALMASNTDVGGLASSGQLGTGGYAPRHYLSQFLPAFSSEEEANSLASAAGFEGWVEFFKNQMSWFANPDLPTLTPWIVARAINDPPWRLSPNPYSIWVDTDGNQLPYLGDITMNIVEDPEVIVLRATAGELDFQDRHLAVPSLPVLLENEQRSGCKLHFTEGDIIDFGLRINLAYDDDPVIGDLLRTVEFRRALSLGIDRDQVNEAFYLGTCTPTATIVRDDNPYFPGEEWRTKWATLDADQANELLDGIGLTEKDSDGYRLRPDGQGRIGLDYSVSSGFGDRVGIGEMIGRHWGAIGIAISAELVDGGLITERAAANSIVLSGHSVGSNDPFIALEGFLPTVGQPFQTMMGVPYGQWFASGGAEGVEPPPDLDLLKEAVALHERGLQAPEEERIEIGKELFRMHIDQVWTIGVVGFGVMINGLYYAKESLGNVPATALSTFVHQRTPTNLLPMTFYYR